MKHIDLGDANVIAVVGKMAAGKNYVCSQLEKQGWNSLDADKLVHKAIEKAADVIYKEFHQEAENANLNILNQDNSINRRELGKLLFSKPELLAKQEEIVYPIITKMVDDFIAANDKVIINATVLFKTPQLLDYCQKIIFVRAGIIKRFIRARKRDKLPYKQIIRRFYAQKDLLNQYKATEKEIIIINN